jgi:hypothetical protein
LPHSLPSFVFFVCSLSYCPPLHTWMRGYRLPSCFTPGQ